MRTCLRRSLATGLVFRRQLPLAPRCYAFLPGCGQGLALATTARPAPLRSALLQRRKLRRYLVPLRNRWPRQQPTPGSDAAQRVSPDFSPEVPVPSRRLRTGFRPFTCSLPAGYPTAPRPARPNLKKWSLPPDVVFSDSFPRARPRNGFQKETCCLPWRLLWWLCGRVVRILFVLLSALEVRRPSPFGPSFLFIC